MRIDRIDRGGMVILKVYGAMQYQHVDGFAQALALSMKDDDSEIFLDLLNVEIHADQVHMLVRGRSQLTEERKFRKLPDIRLCLVLNPKSRQIFRQLHLDGAEGLWETMYVEEESVTMAS